MPRWVEADRVTFKYGLGEEMIGILRTLHTLGLDSTEPVTVKGVQVSPRDVVAACLPDPATIGPRMEGKTCAGLFVTGTGKDGAPRSTYLFHVVDNADSMRDYGAQCVVWQTAINPVVALELLADGTWSGTRRARPRGPAAEALPRPARRTQAGGLRLPVGDGGPNMNSSRSPRNGSWPPRSPARARRRSRPARSRRSPPASARRCRSTSSGPAAASSRRRRQPAHRLRLGHRRDHRRQRRPARGRGGAARRSPTSPTPASWSRPTRSTSRSARS